MPWILENSEVSSRISDWLLLRDHLRDQHGYRIQAYEIGARAAHTIRDILDEMLSKSSFALLVMTPEDEAGDGAFNPTMNVVHELGLFHGRLGFAPAVACGREGASTPMSVRDKLTSTSCSVSSAPKSAAAQRNGLRYSAAHSSK
jgi:hypothetical protein